MDWLPDWLFEGQFTVYGILLAALICLVFIWKTTPRTAYAIGCIIVAALLLLYLLLDFTVETDREQITHSIQEMSAGVQEHNVNRIFDHVSDKYSRNGMDKETFRGITKGLITSNAVDQVIIWGWEFPGDYKRKESESDARENIARVNFMAKPVGQQGIGLYYIEATMHRDADGKWRLQDWKAFDPYHKSAATPVPYLDGR
jgi:hypothetical protein